MFGIKSLKARVAELSQELYWAQCMIYDLQNPYRLSVGEKVNVYSKDNQLSIDCKDPKCVGVVVGFRHNYHKKAPYHVSKHRVNYYNVFNYSTKSTQEFTDDLYLFEIIN